MQWFNAPPEWNAQNENQLITVKTGAKTDFWRVTHYGFTRDNGHFYGQAVEGDFVAEVKIVGQYQDLYDQAGLMVRFDENNWLKTGIEFVEGVQYVSAVVTREFSDWSVVPLSQNPSALWLRLTREKDAVQIFYSLNGANYTMLRLAYFPPVAQIEVGLMCASPDGSGFAVTFENFSVKKA